MSRGPACALPRPVPLLFGVLHAALLRSARSAPRESQRGVRVLRRCARAGQHPRDPSLGTFHPPGRIRPPRAEHGRLTVLHVLRLLGGAAHARRVALPRRARRKAHRRSHARAARGAAVTSEEKYVAAAYLVIFAVVLAYVVIIALKLQRLERELAELAELARDRQEEREAVSVG